MQKELAVYLYEKGRDNLNKLRQLSEDSKVGIFRVGSSGAITPEGSFIGKHPVVALARFLGYQLKLPKKVYNIFDPGFGNEYNWDKYSKASGEEFMIYTDEEYPIASEFRIGEELFKLTGRPDMVICDQAGKIIKGVELKAAVSQNVAKKVVEEGNAKPDNVIQAANYARMLDVPWELVYTVGAKFFGVERKHRTFQLKWSDGLLMVDGRPTNITVDGITSWYEALVYAAKHKDMSPLLNRENIDHFGENYNYWDSYESLLLATDYLGDWDKWITQLNKLKNSNYTIQTFSEKRTQYYQVLNVQTEEVVRQSVDLEETKDYLYNYLLGS